MVSRARHGAALVLALALIVLAGALLAGTSATARAASRGAQTRESIALAGARSRADVATFIASLDSTTNSMAIGSEIVRAIGPSSVGTTGETAVTYLRFLRLDARHCVLGASTQIGPAAAVRARRSVAVLLVLTPAVDSTIPALSPALPAQWAQHLLY